MVDGHVYFAISGHICLGMPSLRAPRGSQADSARGQPNAGPRQDIQLTRLKRPVVRISLNEPVQRPRHRQVPCLRVPWTLAKPRETVLKRPGVRGQKHAMHAT
mgnify:CR=1 FL=1